MHCIVQCIVQSWDPFAEKLGFDSCEHMVAPYLSFEVEKVSYTVLSTRRAGYSPQTQTCTFTEILRLVHARFSGFRGNALAMNREDSTDAKLRKMAEFFVEDVKVAFLSQSLFESTCNEWEGTERFEVPSDGTLPRRFEEIKSHWDKLVRGMVSESPDGEKIARDQEDESGEDKIELSTPPDTEVDINPSHGPCTQYCECSKHRDDLKAFSESSLCRIHPCSFSELIEEEELVLDKRC